VLERSPTDLTLYDGKHDSNFFSFGSAPPTVAGYTGGTAKRQDTNSSQSLILGADARTWQQQLQQQQLAQSSSFANPSPATCVEKFYPYSYPMLAGILGGCSVMFAKSTIELVKTSFQGDNQFLTFPPYVFIVCLAITLLSQMRFLNAGMERYPSLFVIPVYQVFWILSGIVGGAVYFGEFEHFSTLQGIMFPLGASITFLGIFLLSCDMDALEESEAGNADGFALAETQTHKPVSQVQHTEEEASLVLTALSASPEAGTALP